MEDHISRQLIDRIEWALKEVANEVLASSNQHDNLEQVMVQKVNRKMDSLSRGLSFRFPIPSEIEVKNISYKPSTATNGVINGCIVIEHCEKQNTYKYGEPGYPGKEDGQLCEYPENSRKFYKWSASLGQWQDIYHNIDRGNNNDQSWYNKLTNNAAFESQWGSNSGGNYLRNDRKSNGSGGLWGDPGVRKFGGGFKKFSVDIMKSIYSFSLNLKSIIGHYMKIEDALGYGDEEDTTNSDSFDDPYSIEEEPKVKIRIKKVNRWEVGMAFGQYYESGMLVEKDSLIYLKDINKVNQFYKDKGERIKKKARNDFKNDQ